MEKKLTVQILVIDDGRIVERGTHDELLAGDGQYKNLWQRRQKAKSWTITREEI
jgi:ABC-type multidrug transport system fused ATPase/permease subunit